MRNIEKNTWRVARESQPRLSVLRFLDDQFARRYAGALRENPPERKSTGNIALAVLVETVSRRPFCLRRTQDFPRSGAIERRRVHGPDVHRATNRSIPSPLTLAAVLTGVNRTALRECAK